MARIGVKAACSSNWAIGVASGSTAVCADGRSGATSRTLGRATGAATESVGTTASAGVVNMPAWLSAGAVGDEPEQPAAFGSRAAPLAKAGSAGTPWVASADCAIGGV